MNSDNPLSITTTTSGASSDLLPAWSALGDEKGGIQPGLQIVPYDPSRVASRPCATPQWQQELDRTPSRDSADSWESRRAKVNLKDRKKWYRCCSPTARQMKTLVLSVAPNHIRSAFSILVKLCRVYNGEKHRSYVFCQAGPLSRACFCVFLRSC